MHEEQPPHLLAAVRPPGGLPPDAAGECLAAPAACPPVLMKVCLVTWRRAQGSASEQHGQQLWGSAPRPLSSRRLSYFSHMLRGQEVRSPQLLFLRCLLLGCFTSGGGGRGHPAPAGSSLPQASCRGAAGRVWACLVLVDSWLPVGAGQQGALWTLSMKKVMHQGTSSGTWWVTLGHLSHWVCEITQKCVCEMLASSI